LLVEDEHVLRGLIVQFLRVEGYQLEEAGDGREGVEKFASRGPFDLVLLDLDLPFLPGVEVCRRIKLQQPAQPVIICSAAILDGHIAALSALNVNQYLSKPYHPGELLNRIGIELQRSARVRGDAEESASSGSWRVDSAHADLTRSHTLFKQPAID
jgi:two-component system response regulator RegX3